MHALILPLAECKTRYAPNYKVQNASKADAKRVFHDEIPDILEVEDTTFVEVKLINVFREMMVTLQ